MYKSEKVFALWQEPVSPYAGTAIRDFVPKWTTRAMAYSPGNNTRGGLSLPGYRQIIARKGNATTPRSVVYHNIVIEPGHEYGMEIGQLASAPHPQAVSCFGNRMVISTTIPSLPAGPNTSQSAEVDSYCAQKFRAKCEETLVTFGGPTFLGELKETIGFLTKPWPGILRASKRFYYSMLRIYRRIPRRRRNRPGNKRRIAETLENSWLSWKLAISPLIEDIESVCGVISNYDKTVALKVRSAHRGTFSVKAGADNPLGGTMYWNRDTVYRCSMIGELAARIIPPPGTLERVQQMIQMDYRGLIENFVPTVYQLIPMSFVLDYVSNAGAVLESTCVAHPQLAWLSTSRKTVQRRFAVYYPNRAVAPKVDYLNPPQRITIRNVGKLQHEVVTLSRTDERPDIQFYFELPNVFQALTITALSKLASRLLKAAS